MYKIKFIYKLLFYILITIVSIVYFGCRLYSVTAIKGNGQQYTVLDVSKIDINPIDIRAVKPSPFFEVTGQTPPGTPIVPGSNGSNGKSGVLQVIGTLPPDVVILSKAGKTLTARTGETTWMGTIGKVYIDGAWINNVYVPLKK